MKDAYYFSHDANARRDRKILAMMAVYKAEGYGWYWMLVEMMREQEDYRLSMTGKYAWISIGEDLKMSPDKVALFVHDCIHEFHLFDSDGDFFWSESLLRRMDKAKEKREKGRTAAQKRWKKGDGDADLMPTQCQPNANPLGTQCQPNADPMQGKESKGKETKVEEERSFGSLPTIPPPPVKRPRAKATKTICPYPFVVSDEVREWCRDKGLPDPDYQAELMANHFRAKGEARADWTATFRNWMLSPHRKDKPNGTHLPRGQRYESATERNAEKFSRITENIARLRAEASHSHGGDSEVLRLQPPPYPRGPDF